MSVLFRELLVFHLVFSQTLQLYAETEFKRRKTKYRLIFMLYAPAVLELWNMLLILERCVCLVLDILKVTSSLTEVIENSLMYFMARDNQKKDKTVNEYFIKRRWRNLGILKSLHWIKAFAESIYFTTEWGAQTWGMEFSKLHSSDSAKMDSTNEHDPE